MGTTQSNPPPQPPNLSHLTGNPDYQAVLLNVLRNNEQFSFNQVYYNNGNNPNNPFGENANPIKIKKSIPQKTRLSLQKKSINLVF